MTLMKHRPQRTYCAQWIYEKDDVIGLLKGFDAAVAEMGESGLASTPYYVGALLALRVMFDEERSIDKWTDFMSLFEQAMQEMEGE